MDSELLETFVADVRDRATPADEGSVWALFLAADGRRLLATTVTEQRGDPHALAYLLSHVGAAAVVIAVYRHTGAPLEADRALHRSLRTLLAAESTRLRDVLVVGAFGWQSLSSVKPVQEGVA
jgi:hypothetical protein